MFLEISIRISNCLSKNQSKEGFYEVILVLTSSYVSHKEKFKVNLKPSTALLSSQLLKFESGNQGELLKTSYATLYKSELSPIVG